MTLGENFLWIVVLFVPVVLMILIRRFRRDMFAPSNAVWRTALVLVAAILQIVTAMCVGIGGTGYFSNHYFYHSNLTTTDQATDRFGLLTAFRLNITGAAANVQGDENELSDHYIPDATQPDSSGVGTPPVIEYNVLDVDFEALNAITGQIKYLVDESELPANYVENMIKLAQTKMTVAKDMLNQAYYNFVFDAGMVKVNNTPWGNVDGEKKPDKTTPTDPTKPSGPQSTGPVETQPEQKPNPGPTPTPDPTGPSDGPPSTETTEPVEEETTPPTENTETDAEDEQPE